MVSGFLQKHLEALTVVDPFLVRNSEEVVKVLAERNPSDCYAFSVDVEDLFYSLPHDHLMRCVKETITEDNDEVSFRNNAGISIDSFLELLLFYLGSTVVSFENGLYVQKSGVCIGSRVAPILSSIFLGKVDRALQHDLDGIARHVFRYVDDYLVFVERRNFTCSMIDVLKLFKQRGWGLTFTSEVPRNDVLQFLDLSIRF